MRFDKKGTWFLMHNEDRMTIEKLAKIFNCSCSELYDYYDEITKTQEYKDFIAKRTQSIHNREWLDSIRGKKKSDTKRFNDRENQTDMESTGN